MASVTIRWFAMLRERRGRDSEVVEVAPGQTASGLYAAVFPEQPRMPVLFAVNREYVGADRPLEDGDEVAFVPPLGGG